MSFLSWLKNTFGKPPAPPTEPVVPPTASGHLLEGSACCTGTGSGESHGGGPHIDPMHIDLMDTVPLSEYATSGAGPQGWRIVTGEPARPLTLELVRPPADPTLPDAGEYATTYDFRIHTLAPELAGDPQVCAMLQAFYSRSVMSIVDRLKELGNDWSTVRAALNKFFVGYNHSSIGQTGHVTLFIEGVSLCTAKAIQETEQYNGQESSTRYIDLAPVVDGGGASAGQVAGDAWIKSIGVRWCDLSRRVHELMRDRFRELYPLEEGGNRTMWANATNAAAFDVSRGWLPGGLKTNLSLHMDFDNLRKLVVRWLGHPSPEVRAVAQVILDNGHRLWPDAWADGLKGWEDEQVQWWAANPVAYYNGVPYSKWVRVNNRLKYVPLRPRGVAPAGSLTGGWEWADLPLSTRAQLDTRPARAQLPNSTFGGYNLTWSGLIDYGCWRDLQRHRPLVGKPPMLLPDRGFAGWYLDALKVLSTEQTNAIVTATRVLWGDVQEVIAAEIGLSSVLSENHMVHLLERHQGATPLGAMVQATYSAPANAYIYVAEIRSTPHVHPILRGLAQSMGRQLPHFVGKNLTIDTTPSRFNVKRGAQTISKKEGA